MPWSYPHKACVAACLGWLLATGGLQALAQADPSSLPGASETPTGAPALEPIQPASLSAGSVAMLTTPADLWERIRRGFAMPDLQTELVTDREKWYAARPDYLQRMAERSSKYLFHIVEELERRDMPTELALLPFIESAFNPQAVSVAKAAGMWQFMPATGKFFELKQNAFRDDRRDVLASTRAALDYLQKLYTLFGDWHLALAAYNWGEGSVARAIARNQRAGLGTGYTDLSMPQETRYYVPKLQAVKNLVAWPQRLPNPLPDIPNHPFFQTVDIRRDIDVSLAARLAEVSLEDFKALNPSVNRPVILAAGTPQILLPWDNATTFEKNLRRHGDGQLANWTVWIPTSTLTPAEAARKVGMSEAELRRVNEIPARVVIKAGSTLLVPRSARLEQDVASHVADDGQIALAPEVRLQRRLLKAGKSDSVASIARRYGLSAQNVANWNRVQTGASFKPGQPIVLMLPVTPGRTVAQSRKPPPRSVKTAALHKTPSAKKQTPQPAPVKLAKR